MTIQEARRELKQTEEKLIPLKRWIELQEKSCNHNWSPVKYDPVITQGGYDPGDPVGTMGVDRRLPSYYPKTERKKWTRFCFSCGRKEETEWTQTKRISGPIAGTMSEIEEPVFPKW